MLTCSLYHLRTINGLVTHLSDAEVQLHSVVALDMDPVYACGGPAMAVGLTG